MATPFYCYVDESGQDTLGELFIVSTVLISGGKEELIAFCEEVERISGKGKFKWGKAKHRLRLDYMRRIFADPRFRGCLGFSIFRDCEDFDLATIESIAMTIQAREAEEAAKARIYVDGLSARKRHLYGSSLRKMGLSRHTVKGVPRDENHALIRLADAVAGFVRDAITEDRQEVRSLFEQGVESGVLAKVYEE